MELFSGNVQNIWIWLASLILIFQTAAKFFPWGQQILNFPSLMCILAWSIGKQMECMHWLEDPPYISNFSVPWKTLRQWSDCWTLGERNLGLRPALVIVLYTSVDHSLVCSPTYQGVQMATVELRSKLDTGGRGKYLPSNSITFRVDGILLVVFHATETMISLGWGTPCPN